MQLATTQALATYWGTDYDWRKCEAKLNAIPQFLTEIDGQDIHFIHVRSKHENALPLIVTHGWPGSIIEQTKIIGPLTDPTAHGASASDAFHFVIPSIPGYGFSPEPTDPRLGSRAHRKGVDRADGAPWIPALRRARRRLGRVVTQELALQAPAQVLAIHTNMAGTVPADILAKAKSAAPPPAGLAGDELHAYKQLADFYAKHLGYAVEMANRPQTLYGLIDSPIGLAAWILDHDKDSYEMIAPAFAGHPGGLSRDDVLDNITLYWLTKTGVLVGASLLGKQARLLRRQRRHHSNRRQRVSARDLHGAAELVRKSVSETRLLQEARRRRPLCRLGTAATLFRRRSRDVPLACEVARRAGYDSSV